MTGYDRVRVSNASPLIALNEIGQLGLLEKLFGSIIVPPPVANELRPDPVLPLWITIRALTQPMLPQIVAEALGAGESEAIALALETTAAWVILDDRPARRLAEALGVPVIGTLGILLASKRRGLLAEIKPSVDALVQKGFRVGTDLYKLVLKDAAETL